MQNNFLDKSIEDNLSPFVVNYKSISKLYKKKRVVTQNTPASLYSYWSVRTELVKKAKASAHAKKRVCAARGAGARERKAKRASLNALLCVCVVGALCRTRAIKCSGRCRLVGWRPRAERLVVDRSDAEFFAECSLQVSYTQDQLRRLTAAGSTAFRKAVEETFLLPES
jgi:hypothetical protein